eukprot:1859370-Rhodomonas_salina.1
MRLCVFARSARPSTPCSKSSRRSSIPPPTFHAESSACKSGSSLVDLFRALECVPAMQKPSCRET